MRNLLTVLIFFFPVVVAAQQGLPRVSPRQEGMNAQRLSRIDTICEQAIAARATPGCVVLVARDGRIVYEKAFGYLSYDSTERTDNGTIYDLASCTKICATTMAVMKLYEQGKLNLNRTLGDYLPRVRGSDKAPLRIRDVLLHQAGLKAFIPFYKETIDTSAEGEPLPAIYAKKRDSLHAIRVAEGLYIRKDWEDTLYTRILQSPLGPRHKYVYSDNDFIFMAKIVEATTGMRLDEYVKKTFYDPLGMRSTGFLPRERFPLSRIAPTERETEFRRQLLRGDVHDPGSAMFGGVAGHAGLFSDVDDIAILEQMLLNGGWFHGKKFLNKSTIDLFTGYQSSYSRRGYGFDKPEKDNYRRKEPYPCRSASPRTFGHTGYTGTCIWVDPKYKLIYIFLSNRVNPMGGVNGKLSSMNIRSEIQETIYRSMRIWRLR